MQNFPIKGVVSCLRSSLAASPGAVARTLSHEDGQALASSEPRPRVRQDDHASALPRVLRGDRGHGRRVPVAGPQRDARPDGRVELDLKHMNLMSATGTALLPNPRSRAVRLSGKHLPI